MTTLADLGIKSRDDLHLCECGCGIAVSKPIYRFVRGHHRRGKSSWNYAPELHKPVICACGCGKELPSSRKLHSEFIHGHNWRGQTRRKLCACRCGQPIALDSKYAPGHDHRQNCDCGCGELAEPNKRFISRHNTDFRDTRPDSPSPASRAQISTTLLAFYKNPEAIEHRRKIANAQWSDPTFVAKLKAKPRHFLNKPINSPEQQLDDVLNAICEGRFLYNGGYQQKRSVNRKIPDFVEANGNIVIELFGCFWHRCPSCNKGTGLQRDTDKLSVYAENGLRCIVVWQHELKQPEALKRRLREEIGE